MARGVANLSGRGPHGGPPPANHETSEQKFAVDATLHTLHTLTLLSCLMPCAEGTHSEEMPESIRNGETDGHFGTNGSGLHQSTCSQIFVAVLKGYLVHQNSS